jgi:hypothetical protein
MATYEERVAETAKAMFGVFFRERPGTEEGEFVRVDTVYFYIYDGEEPAEGAEWPTSTVAWVSLDPPLPEESASRLPLSKAVGDENFVPQFSKKDFGDVSKKPTSVLPVSVLCPMASWLLSSLGTFDRDPEFVAEAERAVRNMMIGYSHKNICLPDGVSLFNVPTSVWRGLVRQWWPVIKRHAPHTLGTMIPDDSNFFYLGKSSIHQFEAEVLVEDLPDDRSIPDYDTEASVEPECPGAPLKRPRDPEDDIQDLPSPKRLCFE